MEGYHERNFPNPVLSISGEAVIWILTVSLNHAPSRIQQSTQSLSSSSQLTVSHWLPSLLSQSDFSYRWDQLCLVLLLVNTDAHSPSTCSVPRWSHSLGWRCGVRSPAPRRAGREVTLVTGVFFLMHQEVCSMVGICRTWVWLSFPGSLDSIVLLVSQGFLLVVCLCFSIFINFSMEYSKHVYTCNLKSFFWRYKKYISYILLASIYNGITEHCILTIM